MSAVLVLSGFGLWIAGIAAAQSVLAQRPDVAQLGDGFGGRFRDRIGRIVVDHRPVVVTRVQQGVQFIVWDSDQTEVEIFGQKRLKFLQQQGVVPPAQFG